MGARVMSLQDPTKKMSKSDENVNAFISMTDKPEDIIRKFKRAVTDSDMYVKYDVENKPGVSNLLTIYSIFTGKTVEEAEREFEGKGYGEFKQAVGEAVVEVLRPINEKKEALLKDKAYLNKVLLDGKQKAEYLARKMLNKVYKKIGLIQL